MVGESIFQPDQWLDKVQTVGSLLFLRGRVHSRGQMGASLRYRRDIVLSKALTAGWR